VHELGEIVVDGLTSLQVRVVHGLLGADALAAGLRGCEVVDLALTFAFLIG